MTTEAGEKMAERESMETVGTKIRLHFKSNRETCFLQTKVCKHNNSLWECKITLFL